MGESLGQKELFPHEPPIDRPFEQERPSEVKCALDILQRERSAGMEVQGALAMPPLSHACKQSVLQSCSLDQDKTPTQELQVAMSS